MSCPSFSPLIFLRLLAIFPVGEKLIAPGMQRIEYAVIHTRQGGQRKNYIIKLNKKSIVQFALKVDFLISGLSSYVGSENAGFRLPKSSGCRPNLREWWVGEKISLDNDGRQWFIDGRWQSKKE